MSTDRPLETRRLAAILAIDMVGYSRHMQADEAATLRALREARSAVIEPAIARHGGAVFKTTGDGLLAEFSSSVSATQCAVDIQCEMPETGSAAPGQFRIGVSLGEIVVDGDDRYGDGVNLAARLEAVASPGGVSVSRLVRDQTEGKLAARFVSRGALALKNMVEPVEVFDVVPADAAGAPARAARHRRLPRRLLAAFAAAAVAVAGIVAFFALPRVPVPGVVQSIAPLIAVLPFANQSGDLGEEYFSDGITDDVIGALGRFSSLAVLSRNAVMPFKGRQAASDEVVQKLGARYVVEGSARRAGDRVRVQARLTDAQGARVLWSDRFDASTRDLFVLQDELVQQIAGSLASQVDRMERERARRKPTENLDAYDLVLRGRALLETNTRMAHVQARALFEHAMASDPAFADARVGLARVLYFYVQYGFTESPVEAAQEAEAQLREALRLDPANVRALGLLGQILTYFGRYDDAMASIDRALAINPSDAEAYYSRASVLLWVGRLDESGRATDLARRLDPTTASRPDHLFNQALRLILLDEPEQARVLIERHASSTPRFGSLYVLLAIAYAQLDRPDDTARAVATVRKIDPFFDADRFGTRLRDAGQRQLVIEGLRKAGLRPD
ncbi:MAG: adenylate/guanylate cyclase domain-containing protein [Reyranella sp.]|uniref:adenylate/guanylate cyclase domain-containing protein n=1 Tax=Reyranella sp. TaxID=1929291 RepID=UPI0011F5DE6D|nr:tetratricopeptide repeat protein [Reyranella sp.]TAJ36372.1 MAG: adenylate/guanylate cyclase domain-containing protein [Reyranella sp.]